MSRARKATQRTKVVKLDMPQKQFLYEHLRGTGRTITADKAAKKYGIKNLRARMSELRDAGLQVNTKATKNGTVAYSVSARDVNGSRAALVV